MTTRAVQQAARRREQLRRTSSPSSPRHRLIGLLALFVIVGAGFVAVLVDLQTVRPDRYRSLGEDQRTRTRPIAAFRGAVLDRNGFALAVSTPSHQVVADPMLIENPSTTAALLAPVLDLDPAALQVELAGEAPGDRYALLARNVGDDSIAAIEALDAAADTTDAMVGVFVRPEEDRVYPAGDLASAVVGRVDPDKQGIFGLEQVYNHEMTGEPGTVRFEVGRFGSIAVGDRIVDPGTEGDDLVLTLDHRIQYVAEQALLDHCERTGAQGATAVMAHPATGEILAMAGVRRGDDGCFVPNYNPALVDAFEPGSVVKPMVVAGAFAELGYDADTLVEVPNRLSVGGKTFVDHPEHPPAPYPISQILAESMNVGTILLAQRLSALTVYDYLTSFGFGTPSGLGLSGESGGRLRHPDDWWGADHGSIPIGQGMTVNAVQLLGAYNTIAAGGRYAPPVLVRETVAADGTVHPVEPPPSRPVVTPEVAAEVTRALTAVVERGTGSAAAVEGLRVAGKTGTAWKVFDDGSGTLGYGEPGNRRYVVSFVGFLPADDPQISMVIVVDEPTSDTTAATIAAPLFSEIAGYAVRILDIVPTEGVAVQGERVRSAPAGLPSAASREAMGWEAAVADPTNPRPEQGSGP
ncbi:MAG: penicillin-binding protein 2 [Actinomycetota bacterium]